MYRSEIRDSTINQLLEKARERNYGKYLPKLVLRRMRGFTEEPVSFDFPVTAVIGPNGGGKTTILGAAGCAYKDVSPRQFFAKSGPFDESMQNWSVEYELVDKEVNARDVVRRTASFKNMRWRRDALERPVLVFGVSRTVPANERRELQQCASTTFKVPAGRIEDLAGPVKSAVEKILGKDISGFRRIMVDKSGRVSLLSGSTPDGDQYSEFHFGAGESSVIRMVAAIEAAPEQALILVEEIENGLHPLATIRMVEYLIDAAKRKRIQAVFTTHSNDALLPLPSKAVWVATQDRIFQGKLDIQSLRAITGQVRSQVVVFVEDEFAKTWVEAILRQHENVALDHVEVHAMEGDGTAVSMHTYHNENPAIDTPSLCFIDGDSEQSEDVDRGIFRLPGEAPESYVFDSVVDAWDEYGGKLTVAVLQPFHRSEKVKAILKDVRNTNRDMHLLFSQVGEKLGLIPEQTVRAAFANIWAQAHPHAVRDLLAPVEGTLPTETTDTAPNSN
jgi:ABC-type multidrug transport system ATPase subunit